MHQLDVQSRSQLTRYCEEDSNAVEHEYRYLHHKASFVVVTVQILQHSLHRKSSTHDALISGSVLKSWKKPGGANRVSSVLVLLLPLAKMLCLRMRQLLPSGRCYSCTASCCMAAFIAALNLQDAVQ